jgi:hypothetical protein
MQELGLCGPLSIKTPISEMGHSRLGQAASKPAHVRYAPAATKFSITPK